MDPSQVDIPPLKDLTIENITENVHMINSRTPDPRLKYILERLVTHVHDFARETRLSTNEWMAGINFLTSVGQICSDVRQVCHEHSIFPPKRQILAKTASGIYSPLRHNRPLPPCRQHRSPQTTREHRRHSPRSLPHPRSSA